MAENWVDTVDENGDDIRVLSPANIGELDRESVQRYYAGLSPHEPELISVVMGKDDWRDTIEGLRYADERMNGRTFGFIADSIQDVLDGARDVLSSL